MQKGPAAASTVVSLQLTQTLPDPEAEPGDEVTPGGTLSRQQIGCLPGGIGSWLKSNETELGPSSTRRNPVSSNLRQLGGFGSPAKGLGSSLSLGSLVRPCLTTLVMLSTLAIILKPATKHHTCLGMHPDKG